MARACSSAPNRFGNAGRYLKVRNCASENGLSLLTRGRAWLAAMPGDGWGSRRPLLRPRPW